MKFKVLWVIIILLCVSSTIEGQKSYIRKGDKYFDKGMYYEALTMYNVSEAEDNREVLFRRAICNYHSSNLNKALVDLNKSIQKGKEGEEVYLYLAKIYHASGDYKNAIKFYKDFLRNTGTGNNKRKSIINEIKRCANGIKINHSTQIGFIENLGEEFNSRFNEINLVQSPNFNNKYYYSSDRERSTGGKRNSKGRKDEAGTYFYDMYSAMYKAGIWMQTEAINPLLNSAKHEFILDFSEDGSVLYYATGMSFDNNTILTDTFSDSETQKLYSTKLISPIIGEVGDKYISFFNDSTILFSSKRAGGYGGYDLYVLVHRNGWWSEPMNLGPEINSAYDEICPFIAPNGLDLYYSSNNTSSIGGYDIFKSTYNISSSQWGSSQNLGIPVNSPGDEKYFRLATDAISATFCSDRKSGFGGMDGYILYLKDRAYRNELYGELPYVADKQFIASNIQDSRIKGSKAIAKKVSETNIVKNKIDLQTHKKGEEEIVSFKLKALYYDDDDNMVSASNKESLDQLINLLKKFPALKLEMVCNTLKEGITAYDLYYSIKRLEKLEAYIVEMGIDPRRLILKGAGSNYPIAKFSADGRLSMAADRLNRRIDFVLHNTTGLPLELELEEPKVIDYLKDNRNGIYKTIVEGLSYKVQVASVNRMYQNEILKYYADSMIEKDVNNGKYHYTIGLYDDYFSAKELYKDLKQNEIDGILIIPYKDGLRIRRNNVIDHAREFPDLVNYLQYND